MITKEEMIDTLLDYTMHTATLDEILDYACTQLITKLNSYSYDELKEQYTSLVGNHD